MTGRTHDLAAFTALTATIAYTPLQEMTLATALVAVGANFIGGLAPDLDQSTAGLWKKVRGGSIIGKIIAPILGSHRLISHSIVGTILIGILLNMFLNAISNILIVDMRIVWWSFMIGFVSHIFMDSLTEEGVPLFFPFPFKTGIPPIKFIRLKTGGIVEKSIIFPGLIILTGYIVYANYAKFIDLLTNYITR